MALYRAAGAGRLADVERLLARGVSDAEELDSALEKASMCGDTVIIARLIAAGARVDVTDASNDVDDDDDDDDEVEDDVRGPQTPALCWASMWGHVDAVELLLEEGADITGLDEDEDNMTALAFASRSGHLEVVEALLHVYRSLMGTAGCAAILFDTYHLDLIIALREAAEMGHRLVVERLLAAGAEADEEMIGSACQKEVAVAILALLVRGLPEGTDADAGLLLASAAGDLEAVESHLTAGADVRDVARGGVALIAASRAGHHAVVERLLAAGVHVDGNPLYDGPIAAASMNGHTSTVRRLLRAGAHVSQVQYAWRSPLGHACDRGHVDVVALLLNAGADTEGALDAASARGHAHVVTCLLAAGVGVGVNNGEGSALRAACRNGHLAVVDQLLAAGAEVDAPADGPGTPLGEACKGGHLAVLERLMDAGADVHADGDCAMWAASHAGHAAVVQRLLALGADVTGRNGLALIGASAGGHAAVVALLLQAGADVHAAGIPIPDRVFDDDAADIFDFEAGEGDPAVPDAALRCASRHGHLDVVDQLLAAGADVHTHHGSPVLLAKYCGHVTVIARLLAAGANVARIQWFDDIDWDALPSVVQCVRPAYFHALPAEVQTLWLRVHLRVKLRLQRPLQRARDRLDRPPLASEPLGAGTPTRERLIAHLRTAGRRFAREYWLEGLPIFFPRAVSELGPVPDEFLYKS